VKVFFGIDPGTTGAIAAVSDSGKLLLCEDLPITRPLPKVCLVVCEHLRVLMSNALAEVAASNSQSIAMVERAQAFPGQGGSSAFNYGANFGSILTALQIHQFPYDFVSPGSWKKAMGIGKGAHKDASLDIARRLFPELRLERKRDHNMAEAALLAEWSRRVRQ
jgi:crossover junction endodeoxyribonuclease RuvC